MATKKVVKKSKELDLSGKNDKVSPVVKDYIARVNMSISKSLLDSNIPIFEVLKPSCTVEFYFMNHDHLERLLGVYSSQLDRIVISAIINVLLDEMYDTLRQTKGCVGLWDKYILRDLFTNRLHVGNDDGVKYITTRTAYNTHHEDGEYAIGSKMLFSEYNPNKFYHFLVFYRQEVERMITNYMINNVPKAFAFDGAPNINVAMYNLFMEFMVKRYKVDKQFDTEQYKKSCNVEELVTAFTDVFDKPFISTMGTILLNSGISEVVVNETLKNSKINIVYDGTENLNDLTFYYTIRSTLNSEHSATMTFRLTDMIEMLQKDMNTYTKTKKTAFGKLFRRFILDCCTFCANTNIELIKKENTTPEVKEIDVEELNKLIASDGE